MGKEEKSGLPTRVVVRLLSCLPNFDKKRARKVCSRWRHSLSSRFETMRKLMFPISAENISTRNEQLSTYQNFYVNNNEPASTNTSVAYVSNANRKCSLQRDPNCSKSIQRSSTGARKLSEISKSINNRSRRSSVPTGDYIPATHQPSSSVSVVFIQPTPSKRPAKIYRSSKGGNLVEEAAFYPESRNEKRSAVYVRSKATAAVSAKSSIQATLSSSPHDILVIGNETKKSTAGINNQSKDPPIQPYTPKAIHARNFSIERFPRNKDAKRYNSNKLIKDNNVNLSPQRSEDSVQSVSRSPSVLSTTASYVHTSHRREPPAKRVRSTASNYLNEYQTERPRSSSRRSNSDLSHSNHYSRRPEDFQYSRSKERRPDPPVAREDFQYSRSKERRPDPPVAREDPDEIFPPPHSRVHSHSHRHRSSSSGRNPSTEASTRRSQDSKGKRSYVTHKLHFRPEPKVPAVKQSQIDLFLKTKREEAKEEENSGSSRKSHHSHHSRSRRHSSSGSKSKKVIIRKKTSGKRHRH